jgi:acyl-CoA reductase-like NAD-dependent aldehyde dehydrogenase
MGASAETNFIGGRWTADPGGAIRLQHSPIDESPIGPVCWSSRSAAQRAVNAARAAQGKWRKVPVWDRAALLRRIGDAIARQREELARLLTLEQGKPYAEAFFEIGKSVDGFNLAADLVKYLEGATIQTEDPTKRVMTFYQPRGVYAVVTPWNFPVNIPVEYIAPGLAAGNTIVWTPAPTTSLIAVALLKAMENSDLPHGILNLVTGAGNVVGDEIVSNPGTDAVGFTGSAATGKIISQRAAGKPQLMELGGNGPVVICEDADLDRAAAATASGSFVNAGQVCSSSERILVHRKVHDAFAERMAQKAREVVLGDPRKDTTTMGPLNNQAVAKKVAEHVGDAVSRGAEAITGGRPPEKPLSPLYFEPTVLINREETFGPIAPLLRIDSDEQAFEIAADNRYGLVSSVFTQDIDRAFRFVEEMPTGIVNINDTSNYWELHIPFGGISGKDSGMGRVGGRYALAAMCDLKTATFTVR